MFLELNWRLYYLKIVYIRYTFLTGFLVCRRNRQIIWISFYFFNLQAGLSLVILKLLWRKSGWKLLIRSVLKISIQSIKAGPISISWPLLWSRVGRDSMTAYCWRAICSHICSKSEVVNLRKCTGFCYILNLFSQLQLVILVILSVRIFAMKVIKN